MTGNLLATYLAAPEKFHDADGNLTELAAERLMEVGISALTKKNTGTKKALVATFKQHYNDGPTSTALLVALIGGLLLLALPVVRRLLWGSLLWLWGIRHAQSKPGHSFPQHEPLQE